VAFLLAGLFAWVIYLRTRPRWLRERQQQAKRLKGAPIATRLGDKSSVSIVVTDVKVSWVAVRCCCALDGVLAAAM
jgi:hypothetical protein